MKQKYVVVHNDLPIAKPAKQVQLTESPIYDNVFICFGPFHIQLAYIASLDYVLSLIFSQIVRFLAPDNLKDSFIGHITFDASEFIK
jgi:hypothetical protein